MSRQEDNENRYLSPEKATALFEKMTSKARSVFQNIELESILRFTASKEDWYYEKVHDILPYLTHQLLLKPKESNSSNRMCNEDEFIYLLVFLAKYEDYLKKMVPKIHNKLFKERLADIAAKSPTLAVILRHLSLLQELTIFNKNEGAQELISKLYCAIQNSATLPGINPNDWQTAINELVVKDIDRAEFKAQKPIIFEIKICYGLSISQVNTILRLFNKLLDARLIKPDAIVTVNATVTMDITNTFFGTMPTQENIFFSKEATDWHADFLDSREDEHITKLTLNYCWTTKNPQALQAIVSDWRCPTDNPLEEFLQESLQESPQQEQERTQTQTDLFKAETSTFQSTIKHTTLKAYTFQFATTDTKNTNLETVIKALERKNPRFNTLVYQLNQRPSEFLNQIREAIKDNATVMLNYQNFLKYILKNKNLPQNDRTIIEDMINTIEDETQSVRTSQLTNK